MIIKSLRLLMVWLCALASAFAQERVDKYGVYRPTQEEIAKSKRIAELLRHPTFVRLRLISMRRFSPREEPSTTPSPYTVDEWINSELFITQNSTENIVYWSSVWPYYQYRPELIRDGDVVPYSKETQEKAGRADKEPASGSGGISTLVPGREYHSAYVKVEDWYDSPLPPGHYQLIVRKRFRSDGAWVESNPVTFDVIPRKTPSPIPDGVSLRLVPYAVKQSADGRNRVGDDAGIALELINRSDRRVQVNVIDGYYGHRPQLFKDGKLIPYREEIAKLIESREKDARLVEVVSTLFLDPKTASRLDGFSLKQWYGPLPPGVYRLTDSRRFEIEGPWTKDSAELILEVVPQE
jgi:hypothetical protein